MTVTINGVDYTSSIIAPSVKIDKEATYQNDIELTIRTTADLRAGMEIIWTDGSDVVFGGILQTPKRRFESPTTLLQTVKSSGYKQILAKRSFSIDDTDFNAGDTIQDLFDRFLKVGGTDTTEEFTLGTIDTGAVIARKKGIFNGYKLFTELAESSGYRWWVQPDKSFYFTDAPTYTAATKEVTDDPLSVNPFSIFEYPTFTEDLSKFRTRQYVIGKDADGAELVGLAINATEETRLEALFGSGVYGNIVYDDNLKTETECDDAAQALLDANSEAPQFLTIKTRDFIDVNQTVNVDLSLLNISDVEFIVSSVSVRYDQTENWLYYEATLRKALDTASQQSSWTDDFNRGLTNRQTENKVIRTSSDTKFYSQPNEPTEADALDVWNDTDDYSNADIQILSASTSPIDLDDGYIVFVSGSSVTLTLDSIANYFAGTDTTDVSPNAGIVIEFVNTDASNSVTIARGSTDTIEGSTSYTLTAGSSAKFYIQNTLTDWKVR